MGKMLLHPPARRAMFSRPRPRSVFILVLAAITTYFLVFSGPSPRLHIVPYKQGDSNHQQDSTGSTGQVKLPFLGTDETVVLNPDPGHHHEEPTGTRAGWEIDIEDLANWHDMTDLETNEDVLPGYETDGTQREPGDVMRLQHEKDLRKMWRYAYKTTAKLGNSNLIYGNTLKKLVAEDEHTEQQKKHLVEDPTIKVDLGEHQPVRFNPYPAYNSDEWRKAGHAPHVPCKGPTGQVVEDLLVFRGRPEKWPLPKFGSYELLGLDPNLCWERDTRLGPYGLHELKIKSGASYKSINWDNINWGELQKTCVLQNAARFDTTREKKNPYLNNYPETREPAGPPAEQAALKKEEGAPSLGRKIGGSQMKRRSVVDSDSDNDNDKRSDVVKEPKTAILLRSYTGKKYTDNDRQVIRALVSELSLKTGGQYEVFLLVHSKNETIPIHQDAALYQAVLNEHVPVEFHGITVLWNDPQVWDLYPAMTDEYARAVHSAQWLSVQKFSQDNPQFDFMWNWEMDFRYTGHHYDLLEGLSAFAKKQPRKYLWERNERYYIPEFHGDYDTSFRQKVAEAHGNETVWGPPELPFIKPVGPKPPRSHEEDNYEWGVGEEADFITVGPMFNPVDSQWIISKHVWGYTDADHQSTDLPRRTTIVTQSRISKRLLAIMHVENMRGNHVASEMTAQTVALLHGLKTVFAPHPVFMDRDWKGGFLNNWFNPGPHGECGGRGSPMGWGRERRYQGTTWYYRAEPPNRLYNNWMGWPDTDMGGPSWEKQHGRPCLPSVMLHPIKDSMPTKPDHKTEFDLLIG
ncbi:hypothetical protein E4U30_001827 [Claviceps sp. LM220 group G6]|nr:hypothetical protein E4U15_002890 [Claviceps sp. LM218 group G6]KAG6091233.1 hypothetical protein E4U31_007300 [Claviceps sp. LM219 group G6]KAG6096012.1 hypothetical protein E4U30_001827 [Claviceps sp. LM220 group G6]